MKKEKVKKIITLLLALAPAIASAQSPAENMLATAQNAVNDLVPIMTTLVVVIFFWGLAKAILYAGNEEKRGQAKGLIIGGVIGMFVMLSIWGIVGFIQETIGLDKTPAQTANIFLPGLNLPK